MSNHARLELVGALPEELVDALVACYDEVKAKIAVSDFRQAELEGGRFAEVALRCIQHLATGTYIAPDERIRNFSAEVQKLEQLRGSIASESLRLIIPKVLLAAYTIRNKRDVGHYTSEIDPTLVDATLVATSCDWVMAEMFRLISRRSIDESQSIVNGFVTRAVPVIQFLNGTPKVLNPNLSIPDKILILLYQRDQQGASVDQLKRWLKGVRGSSVMTALGRLEIDRAFVHRENDWCVITQTGTHYIEDRILLQR